MNVADYFFVSASNMEEIIIPEVLGGNYEGDFCLLGSSDEGNMVISENITSVSDLIATDIDGTEYHLKNMSKDYADFIDAYILKIPIIENWELENIPLNCFLLGLANGEKFNKKIVEQSGNFFTFEDGTTGFVKWNSMSELTQKRMQISYYHTYFTAIEDFCTFKCKVII